MEIRATITYHASPSDDEIDALHDALDARMRDHGPVLAVNTAAGTLDVMFAFDEGPLADLRPFAPVVSAALHAAGLGVLEPLKADAVDAAVHA